MRDFSEEHSLLHELSARLAERPVLVTFNGKSFDWPLLENRFTMTRAIRVPSLAAHLDLLHPARALWKLRLGSVRLVELERHVLDAARLGWHREDDVSSALIPNITSIICAALGKAAGGRGETQSDGPARARGAFWQDQFPAGRA